MYGIITLKICVYVCQDEEGSRLDVYKVVKLCMYLKGSK